MNKLVMVAFLAAVLAACGGKSNGATTPATPAPGQVPATDGTGGDTYGAPAAPSGDAAAPTSSAEGQFVDPCAAE